MINYRKTITIDQQGDLLNLKITTDKNDQYKAFRVEGANCWTKWWSMNHQSDLRHWQKDMVTLFATRITDLRPYVVYKPNHGGSQPHDIMIAACETQHYWFLATADDFWIKKSSYGSVEFDREASLGSVLRDTVRSEIFAVYDGLYGKPERV